MRRLPGWPLPCLALIALTPLLPAQSLDRELLGLGAQEVAAAAKAQGDSRRGAVVFYQKQLACTRCHVPEGGGRLGPDLSALGRSVTDAHLVESILEPSKVVREGYATVLLEQGDESFSGLLVRENADEVVIRDAGRDFKEVRFARAKLTGFTRAPVSLMPPGLANALTSRQQFFDLVRYLMDIRDGGAARARELEPDPSLYVERPLPAYEGDIDHAGLIRGLDKAAFGRGKAIYETHCVNCHGTQKEPGSLPTSLKFASGRFKNGSDPFTMYQTLTRGFGMMTAQTWMVPSQKYDVIHYVREAYLAPHNEAQYFAVDDAYLARLPKGKGRGPAPAAIPEWARMDYGPNQIMSLEVGDDASNFAYKGNAIRLDAGPGGVAQGRYWMVFDEDTMRVAAAWTGEGFIDWNSIHFNGRHAIHPRVVGAVQLENLTGPGWGRPGDGSFEDVRLVGRDGRRYGPLPRAWAQYRGMYYHGPDTILEYTVGATRVLELPGVQVGGAKPVFTRTFDIGPRKQDLVLQVAHRRDASTLRVEGTTAVFGAAGAAAAPAPAAVPKLDGSTGLEVVKTAGLNAGSGDFTVAARIKTKGNGTILAQTAGQAQWQPNGLTFFIRGGRLAVDIGWVGAFSGRRNVADGKWHHVACTYRHASGEIRFFVDGKAERRAGKLQRKAPLDAPVVRIGYTAENFPKPSYFTGDMAEVRFFNRALAPDEAVAVTRGAGPEDAAARWNLAAMQGEVVRDEVSGARDARVARGAGGSAGVERPGELTVAGVLGETGDLQWTAGPRDLRLRIPAGDGPRRFTLWFAGVDAADAVPPLVEGVVVDQPARDLSRKTGGGPARWPHVLESVAILGAEDGPFAVDVLKRPTDNPWFCRMRLTGFDFTADGDKAIVSAWDGSIWRVEGLGRLPARRGAEPRTVPITWRRIASGLFQPLGVKIVGGRIYVTCRDQLCILNDKDGDGEVDHVECFNGDHQVTEHFHEFAMGLQTDAEGNFYYAKSARHAKTALVPHHGTLLKVSKDGSRTEIVATGFRAANGVCINPDGTFIVTDQEGHWNPKNRINYVRPGRFYGNMYGYHDVTDSSDAAMEQPLVWITNAFDRSPGELLWVDSERWGPLDKHLLNLSYGYGQVYIVPHERVGGREQGGMCAFPIPRFPTGVMRGRFHPGDGQLYLAGMFAWAGNQTQPGGFYRLRYTGAPVHLPVDLRATPRGVSIGFSGRLDRASATDAASYAVKVWGLKRTASYGSKHYAEHPLQVTGARLADDGRTVHLDIEGIAPTWCMEITWRLKSTDGAEVRGKIHNTIHELGAGR